MLIIHGDNTIGSRNLLNQKIEEMKKKGVQDVVRLNGKKVKIEEIKQALEAQSLFGTDRLVVIEDLITRPKSKDKKEITTYLGASDSKGLILWEQKKLTKTQTKPFKTAQIQEFKTPTIIFKFLEMLGNKNKSQLISLYEQCIVQDSASSVFFMLSRQVRLLIQSTDPQAKIAPWQKGKLASQLKMLGLEKVLWMHEQLLLIDERFKTGRSSLGMEGELELLLAKL